LHLHGARANTHTHTHTLTVSCHISMHTHLCRDSELCNIFHPGNRPLVKVGVIFLRVSQNRFIYTWPKLYILLYCTYTCLIFCIVMNY